MEQPLQSAEKIITIVLEILTLKLSYKWGEYRHFWDNKHRLSPKEHLKYVLRGNLNYRKRLECKEWWLKKHIRHISEEGQAQDNLTNLWYRINGQRSIM